MLERFIVWYNMVNVIKVPINEVPCKEQGQKNIMEVPVHKNAWFSLIDTFSHNTPHEKKSWNALYSSLKNEFIVTVTKDTGISR